MSRPDKCLGPGGKDIYLTRAETRAALAAVRTKNDRRGGKTYRCIWGDHYHYTKSGQGRKR